MADETLRFQIEWFSPVEGVRAPELAATWARLDIAVGDRHLTLAEDVGAGTTRHSIMVPIFPLAEWIAYNWWSLRFGTIKGAFSQARPVGINRVRDAGDGFAWPSLCVQRDGDGFRLTWEADTAPYPAWPLRFIASGTAWVDSGNVVSAFSELVDSTLARLEDARLLTTPLHEEWQAIQALDREEVDFCEACGRIGSDPFAEGAELADALDAVYNDLDRPDAEDVLDAVTSDALEPGLEWIRQARVMASEVLAANPNHGIQLASGQGVADGQPSGLGQPPSSRKAPWTVGYSQAQGARRCLGVPATDPISLEQLPVTPIAGQDSPSAALQALSVSAPDRGHAALVLGWNARPATQLFAGARSLWSLLHARGDTTVLTSGAASRRQQESRAFAAELLAPAAGIQALLADRPGMGPTAIADHFGVSEMVVDLQIQNQLCGQLLTSG